MVHQIATFTRHRAIEVSIERGVPNALPDNYLREVDLLERRDKTAMADFMDDRLQLWQEFLL